MRRPRDRWDWTNTRRWDGWYRHITLAMLAHAYLAVVRHQASSQGRLGEKGAPQFGRKADTDDGARGSAVNRLIWRHHPTDEFP